MYIYIFIILNTKQSQKHTGAKQYFKWDEVGYVIETIRQGLYKGCA